MMKLVFGILISLLLPLAVCVYYSGKELKEASGFSNKIKTVFNRTKKEYIVLAISVVACIATYAISQYIYHQADIFWTYRWQIAIGVLVPIAVIDFKEQIIPNKLLLIGLAFTFATVGAQIACSPDYFISILGNAFIGLVAGGGIFFFASLFVKNGIGAGDIKMFLLLGFLVAFRGIFNVLLYSMVISAVYAIVLLIIKKKTTTDELPLAPFTLIGIVISILFGV